VPYLPDWLVNACQVVAVLALAPLVTGVIARLEAIVQMRRGPRLLQPYHDIAKLLRKETVLPGSAGAVFRAAPYVSLAAYATVPLLIPVLTDFPLPLGYMGYALAATLTSSAVEIFRPSHLLAAAAFFMVVLAETGRIPTQSHGGTLELGMIEEARTLEHSGPGLALLRWGASVKQLVLFVILGNVFLVPWGLAGDGRLDHVLEAVGVLLVKALATGLVIVAIESSFAKLRLYKIPEFTVASFLLAVLAVIIFAFEQDFGDQRLTLFGAVASVAAVGVLLLELGMLRSQDIWEQLRLYGLGPWLLAGLAIATAATGHGNALYALGAVTIAFKGLLFPLGIGTLLRNLEVPPRVPSLVGVPTAILLAVALSSFSFLALSRLDLGTATALPRSALAVAVAGVLVAFLLMVLRPYAPSQLLGFLALENAVSVAGIVVAPGLPLILALLLLFDVLIGVLVFVVLVQYLAMERSAVATDVLSRLRG
jgi:formate hydrogenlyase subunit 4/hydrogenase-4 membrane subunit HyfE